MAVRTTVPMLRSCRQFSMATWKGCRRRSRSATIASTRPVAVPVDDVAAVAGGQQFGVVAGVVGPGSRPRTDADAVENGLRGGELPLGVVHPGHASGTMDDAMTALPLVFDAPRRGMPPRHLADLTREEARAAVTELGHPAFRADQLARHYYRGITDPAEMTDVPAAAREALAEALLPGLLTVVRHQTADNGRTRKTLWRLHDGALVESVLMRYPDRATVCISSQAGCGMACPFCATGQAGLTRNLSAAEIIGQAVAAAAAMANGEIDGGPGRLSNVVFMGMGEPLANYARVRKTLDALLTPAPHGLGLSQRSVTVSTVGLVRRSGGSPRRAATSPSRSACTPRTTSCATRSCRSTPAGRSARSSTPPTPTRGRPAAATRSSTP